MPRSAHLYIGPELRSRYAPGEDSVRVQTERAQAGVSPRLEGILESAMDAIISVDASQRIVLFNAAAERMFGVPAREALGTSLDRFIPERYRESHSRHVHRFGQGGVHTRRMGGLRTISGLRANGEEFPIEASISQALVGGETTYTVILRDITERKRLESGILAAVEQEQQRLGRDLHDGLCQLLTATKFRTGLLERKVTRKIAIDRTEIRTLEEQLNQAIKQAHNLARGLNPVKLGEDGLAHALEELAASFESAFQVNCVCEIPEPVSLRDHAAAHHLYRIAQEALHNAVQHGKARNIKIRLQSTGAGLALRISNDGVGFPRAFPRRTGMGLSNMKARAGMIGARLEIQRGKQGGTVVTCDLERSLA